MILGEELRYNYGVDQCPWRKSKHWKKNQGEWVFQKQIEVGQYKWYEVEDNVVPNGIPSCTERPVLIGKCSELSDLQIDDIINNAMFTSIQNLKRADLLQGSKSSYQILKFPHHAAKPLGVPDEYIQTPKNGACFYSALSTAFYGTYMNNHLVRRALCDYLLKNQDIFQETGGDPIGGIEQFIKKHRLQGTFADHIQIVAASRHYDVNIFVYSEDLGKSSWKIFIPSDKFGSRGNVYLKLIDMHYMLVIGLSTNSREMPDPDANSASSVFQLPVTVPLIKDSVQIAMEPVKETPVEPGSSVIPEESKQIESPSVYDIQEDSQVSDIHQMQHVSDIQQVETERSKTEQQGYSFESPKQLLSKGVSRYVSAQHKERKNAKIAEFFTENNPVGDNELLRAAGLSTETSLLEKEKETSSTSLLEKGVRKTTPKQSWDAAKVILTGR